MNKFELKREDFINQYPPLNMLNKRDVDYLFDPEPYNIYVHIPFCSHRCDFCYYKTFNHSYYKEGIPTIYFEALLNEIKIGENIFALSNRKCHTIYIGGGTPSLLSCRQMELLFECLKKHINIAEQCEICFEVRPGPELTSDKLFLMRNYNVTRISMGCQSLNDNILRINGRTHNSAMFLMAYEKVCEYKFPVINVDLMSGLCGETEDSFLSTLEQMVELAPQNITIYKLEIYLNSVLYRKVKENDYSFMSNEQEAQMVAKGYRYLLSHGYILSDNFSFALDKRYEHVHRVATWFGEDMIGLGLSSHSRKGHYLYQNESRMEKYIEIVNSGKLPIQRAYKFTPYENMVREMIFAIKKTNYDMRSFYSKFGVRAEEIFDRQLNELFKNKFIEIEDHILRTTFEGMLYADDIVRIFYPEKQRRFELAHMRRD